jgi:hypothetical protein
MNPAATPPVPAWDLRLQRIAIFIGRIGLAYLFFTQLFWKLPPTFGCANNFAFPAPAEEGYWQANGSSGLCFWLGIESVFAGQPRQVLEIADPPAGIPQFGVPITPLAQLNGAIVDNVIKPGIGYWGWLIWLAEFWVFVSMLLGLFTRLGALTSLAVSAQLYVALANIPRPFEWEWSYGLMVLLSILMLGLAPGRVWGVDAALRRRFLPGKGWFARLVAWLT